MREAQLGIAVGKRGIGKTHTTLKTINSYVQGGENRKPRRVLIMDVNDEFSHIPALKIKDVALVSRHPKIEARRIRPYMDDNSKMTITDICSTLFFILENFKGGLLLIEDINKYLTHNFPKDVIGAICTNRHNDCDIIMHYQAIGKVPTTVWENANWIRFHKNNQSVDRHKAKFEDKYEMLKITETLVDFQYDNGNERFYAFLDLDFGKIKGDFDQELALQSIQDYLSENYNKTVAVEYRKLDIDGNPKYSSKREAYVALATQIYRRYYMM